MKKKAVLGGISSMAGTLTKTAWKNMDGDNNCKDANKMKDMWEKEVKESVTEAKKIDKLGFMGDFDENSPIIVETIAKGDTVEDWSEKWIKMAFEDYLLKMYNEKTKDTMVFDRSEKK